MAELKEIYTRDTDLGNDQNSWSAIPTGFLLLIDDSPDYYLLIDDNGNKLLIE
jgi:hypothetical protein